MRILLVADKENQRYYQLIRQCLDGHTVYTPKVTYPYLKPYLVQCKREKIDTIILSNSKALSRLITDRTGKQSKDNESLQKWAGAILELEGIQVLVSRPFKQITTVDYSKFLLRWYVRKLQLKALYTPPPMVWARPKTNAERQQAYNEIVNSEYMAVDIETTLQEVSEVRYAKLLETNPEIAGIAVYVKQTGGKPPKLCIPIIDMIGYTALLQGKDGRLYSTTIVLDVRTMEDIYWMRKFNSTEATKICQNGGYEGSHLIRYNAPLKNWLGDTFHMGHCQYAEMPRTLADLAAFWLANFEYWKDEIGSQRALYNAKDTYTTLWIWVYQVRELQDYARTNYLIEFRKCFPAITSGLEGFRVDHKEQQALWDKYYEQKMKAQKTLQTLLGKYFNPDSPTQLLPILNAFTKFKVKKTDKKALVRWGESGALQAYIADNLKVYREAAKKLSTYLEATLFDGRMLYEVNHGGTDTGRAASKGSNFWCGGNIQNQDNKLRSMYTADTTANGAEEDWVLANQDGSQAESRTTAYISEDQNLMETVETAPDFHSRNASMFFGIPESEIIQTERDLQTGKVHVTKVLRPEIRKLSKPVNHGSNYNMGRGVLLETMGTKAVLDAKALLNLPAIYGLADTCEHLLGTFVNTYPDVKGKYYDEVFEEIKLTGRLVGATGWTRICFGTPIRDGHKPTINKYVAHQPQSLSVMIIDEAEFDFWLEYQIEKNMVRLKAQVHDEVVYQTRPEHLTETKEALGVLVSRPYEVKGRQLIIPTDGGGNGYRWSELK
jgi:hypothetical protein